MESLNIAFYSDTYLPAMDGVVNSIINTRKELERRGHNVYLFVSGDSRTRKTTRNDKNIFIIPGAKFNKYPQYNIAFFPFSAYFKYKDLKINLIHAHTPMLVGMYALMLSRMNKQPIVGSFHTLFTEKDVINEYVNSQVLKKYALKYSWKYARYFYNRCNATIAPTLTIKDLLEKKRIRNVSVVPNGIDTKRFNPKVDGSEIRGKLAGNKKVILYVGRLSKEKHVEVLLRAMKLLDDNYMLIIGGTGPSMQHYMSLSARLNLSSKVRFVGFIKDELLPQYYAAADVVCLPSTFETQGMVVLEAMAVGKPVIGANKLALKEIIKNGKNGEKFEPGDYTGCARKIEKVINNMDSYKETISTAKNYSVENATEMLINLYKEILNNYNNNAYQL
ncbi:MAG: glycosyltransferase [Candidatus Micrarchaeia archaeon]